MGACLPLADPITIAGGDEANEDEMMLILRADEHHGLLCGTGWNSKAVSNDHQLASRQRGLEGRLRNYSSGAPRTRPAKGQARGLNCSAPTPPATCRLWVTRRHVHGAGLRSAMGQYNRSSF